MPKTTKKTVTPKISKKVTKVKKALPLESVAPQKSLRKVNFFPIIAVLAVIAIIYSYYRFGIVATVNGAPISRISYLRTLEKQDKKQTIKQMANEALVLQEAVKKGVSVDVSDINAEIASVEAEIKAQGQTLEAALVAEGMTKADLEKQIRIQKVVEKLANPNLDITQAKIDDFLKTNKASLPSSYTKDQLQELAKTQLISEAKNTAINNWFAELQKNSKIIIR
jgi:hypothetical protein